ncbi:MAG TPA: nucleoside triphosphate pyrophosphohydrolase [Planctomycetota bacterium]|nr:nucleoside triphosphate pyrophosphohydrolase [Planctomycetota bacterium]
MDPRLRGLQRLLDIVDRLRAPDGCPWDREQTLRSMAPCVLEEAYELVDTLGGTDDDEIRAELGDLLMNCVLLGRIAEDEGRFSIGDVASTVADKLVRRHPHVFGDAVAKTGEEALRQWAAMKARERGLEDDERKRSALAGVPRDLPGLLRALRVGEKAARVGFDWPDVDGPVAKVDEEWAELRAELAATPRDTIRVREELGDLLFSIVNLARRLGEDPELALRETIERFSARFRDVERELGPALATASLAEMEAAWQRAKERKPEASNEA